MTVVTGAGKVSTKQRQRGPPLPSRANNDRGHPPTVHGRRFGEDLLRGSG
jgi:hypothetical protein